VGSTGIDARAWVSVFDTFPGRFIVFASDPNQLDHLLPEHRRIFPLLLCHREHLSFL
jgi:hypothetical protein